MHGTRPSCALPCALHRHALQGLLLERSGVFRVRPFLYARPPQHGWRVFTSELLPLGFTSRAACS